VGFVDDGLTIKVVSGGADTNLRYWTNELHELEIGHDLPNIIYDLEVSNDYSAVVTGEGGWNGSADADTLRIFDAGGAELEAIKAPIGYVYSVVLSPDQNYAIASGFYGDHVVFKTDGLVYQDITQTKKKRTRDLAFSPDGSLVAAISTAGILLYAFPAGTCDVDDCQLDLLLTLSHPGSWSFSLAFDPTSNDDHIRLVSGSDGGTTKFWTITGLASDPSNPDVSVRTIESGDVYSVAWSADGDKVVAGESGDITVYDGSDAGALRILFRTVDAHAGRVNDVAFSPEGDLIVSGGADGTLKLWAYPDPPPPD
jgi:WD40 repeat protein